MRCARHDKINMFALGSVNIKGTHNYVLTTLLEGIFKGSSQPGQIATCSANFNQAASSPDQLICSNKVNRNYFSQLYTDMSNFAHCVGISFVILYGRALASCDPFDYKSATATII